MRIVTRIALALVIIGALNWGMIGLFQFDLVATLFGGQDAVLARIVYTLVGLSGIVCIGLLFETDDAADTGSEYTSYTRPDFNTEFGEEPDFSDPRTKTEKKTDDDTML
ncbi:DUF378 domain-containing protein [Sporosarcina trichiuri]|uniref:DUF378 domain-containing protein n=1 Tax=Sporosarcina trichiuri TaxID=3056445 RepID=UPI0025B39146|nr:DUF378 domain-containing protein [Sporosarcina sp. 0.2-SM1T-5]WJY26233.1 DUF378 domain-containing protein [Sporosarcina sp. 0.2-SM1T-5]